MRKKGRILSQELHREVSRSISEKINASVRKKHLDTSLVAVLRKPLAKTDPRYIIRDSFMCVSYSEAQGKTSLLDMIYPDLASCVLKAAEQEKTDQEKTDQGILLVKIPRWQVALLAKYVDAGDVKSGGFEVLVNEVLSRCATSLAAVTHHE